MNFRPIFIGHTINKVCYPFDLDKFAFDYYFEATKTPLFFLRIP